MSQQLKEMHERRVRKITKKATYEAFNLLHFVVAELWIVGVLVSISASWLLIAVGVALLATNIIVFILRFAAALEHDARLKEEIEDMKTTIRREILEKLHLADK